MTAGCWRITAERRGTCVLAYRPSRAQARRLARWLRNRRYNVRPVERCTEKHA